MTGSSGGGQTGKISKSSDSDAMAVRPAVESQDVVRVSSPSDPFEREADKMADRVMQLTESAGSARLDRGGRMRVSRPTDPHEREADRAARRVVDVSRRLRVPLTPAIAAGLLGADTSEIRIGVDDGSVSGALGASAYTVGNDVTFAPSEYRPGDPAGDRTLVHEIAHVAQPAPANTISRDLKAYDREKIDVLPSAGTVSASTSYVTHTAEAPGLRAALAALIASGKVREVSSRDGNVTWFAAQHHRNAQLDEIRDALTAARYSEADRLARSIYDIHGEYLYSGRELTTVTMFGPLTRDLGERVETVRNRSMTEWEIRQARRVFGNAIDYQEVTIADGSISARVGSVGGYARTVGNVINFPTGSSRNMGLMIHELTHVWQYQTVGWTYAPSALWAQVTEGYSYTAHGKTAEQSLIDARADGETLTSYNKEQQGDILADYYRRLRNGDSVAAWEPFVSDIPGR